MKNENNAIINLNTIYKTLVNMPLDGGATLRQYEFKTYKTGWQVATDGVIVHTPQEAMKAIENYKGTCGIWRDPDTGDFCIDKSHRVNTKREAMEIGLACGQKSVLRWRDMACITCE